MQQIKSEKPRMVFTKTSSIMNRIRTGLLYNTVGVVSLFLLLLLSCISRTYAVNCGRCYCSEDVATGDQNAICLGIPFAEIRTTFAGNVAIGNINRFDIVPEVGDSKIPAGLLGLHTVRIIHLASCGNNLMEINRNAFDSSSGTMQEFVVYDCNVGSMIWTFLDGFTSLNLLQLEGATNIQSLGTLPSLPSLKRVSITNCKGFGSLIFPGPSLNGLQNLIMKENTELTDEKLESILATLAGANILEIVSLKNNPYISIIPSAMKNFIALHSLDLSLCDVNSILSDSLSFSAAVKILDLRGNFLTDISDDSFEKGYYGNAKVSLDDNQLTIFSSTVFLKILTEMQTSQMVTPGSVSIRKNPIKCDDCQMAWLIRDYRELLPFVSGTCSNATEFQELNPSWYDNQLCEALITTILPTTTFKPTTTAALTTTFETTPETVSSTMSVSNSPTTSDRTSTTVTMEQGNTTFTGTGTTFSPVETTTTTSSFVPTDPNQTTTSTRSNSSGMTTSFTESPTVTTDSSTTTTTKIPNSSVTSLLSSSTFGSSTTRTPDESPAEINYDIFFYFLYGVLGCIALILICGFIFLDYRRRKVLRARTRLAVSSSRDSSLSRRMDPESHNPRSQEQRTLDPYVSYVRMPARPPPARPPPAHLRNHQQSRRQSYRGTVSITTPYQQQPAKNQLPPPSSPVRGLRRF